MEWCIAKLALPPGSTICDPYMGSGSTGVAALKMGFKFVGFELEPLYFETACRRLAEVQRQGQLFAAGIPVVEVK